MRDHRAAGPGRRGVDGRLRSIHGQIERSQQTLGITTRTSVTVGDRQNHLRISEAETSALVGRTQAEVEARFGKPRYVRPDLAARILVYSRSPSSTHYRLREIGVGSDGKVVDKQAYFYWD